MGGVDHYPKKCGACKAPWDYESQVLDKCQYCGVKLVRREDWYEHKSNRLIVAALPLLIWITVCLLILVLKGWTFE